METPPMQSPEKAVNSTEKAKRLEQTSKAAKGEEKMLKFLVTIIAQSGIKVDYVKLAKSEGISKSTAQQKAMQVRNLIEKFEVLEAHQEGTFGTGVRNKRPEATKGTEKTADGDDDNAENNSTVQDEGEPKQKAKTEGKKRPGRKRKVAEIEPELDQQMPPESSSIAPKKKAKKAGPVKIASNEDQGPEVKKELSD